MIINNRAIGKEHPPFIIAELSANHNRDIQRAFDIIKSAKECGADAVKIQTYTADTITLNVNKNDFFINDNDSLWSGSSLYDLYEKAHTPWEWHKPIMKRANELGMLCFSSPFDESAVDFLEDLNVPAYKIASFENNHLPLIKKASSTGKPIIISTGMATVSEIHEAVVAARESGCKDLILLKCTSTYPATPESSNILTIPHMRELFDCEVGLSDHTMGVGTSIAAVAHGATVIEKHFTISRDDGGVDSTFSLEPNELELLVIETKRAFESLGKISYGIVGEEEKSKIFRRSLYIAEDMNSGDIFTKDNLRIVRPGEGLKPKYYDKVLGRKVNCDVKKGHPVSWGLLV